MPLPGIPPPEVAGLAVWPDAAVWLEPALPEAGLTEPGLTEPGLPEPGIAAAPEAPAVPPADAALKRMAIRCAISGGNWRSSESCVIFTSTVFFDNKS